jgi:hypothetical protein
MVLCSKNIYTYSYNLIYAYSGQSKYQTTTCGQEPTKSELIWKFGVGSGDGWAIHFVSCPMK